jgi:hypothetical protein
MKFVYGTFHSVHRKICIIIQSRIKAAVLQWCVMCSQQNLHRNKINVHSIFKFVIMVTQLSLNLINFNKRCEEFSMLK